jgi:acyl-CoA thioester hydrolase
MINRFPGEPELHTAHQPIRPEGRLVHVERMDMRWGDMDALGHMNNAVYFRYLEQARISWFDSIGADYRKLGEGAILGSISCRFIRPIVYPAALDVTLVASSPRRSTFSLFSEMRDAADAERVYARAEAVMVWIDLAAGKSRPLPDWVRQHLG